MKTVLVMLFSVALALPQTVFMAVANADACAVSQDRCPCGDCPAMACCASPGNNVPARLPVAPAPSFTSKNLYALLVIAIPVLTPPTPAESVSLSGHYSSSKVAAVPLYERNCSFLI